MSVGARMLEHMRYLIVERGNTASREKPLTVTLHEKRVGVEAEVYAYDNLGMALGGLTVQGDNRHASLETLAQSISRRVTYLWEPLALTERDVEHEKVQMRSAPPLVEDKTIEFYEGWLTRHDGSPRVHLARYRRENEPAPTVQVPITLTHETFRRLVDDLATVLRAPEA